MKKYLAILLAAMMLLVVAGCNSGSGSSAPAASGSDASASKTDEEWPKDKITVVVPFKAGGSADIMARNLIKYWEPLLGVPMVVENRDGAATMVGSTYFMNQPADGNTIYIGTQAYLSQTIVVNGAEYKIEDFDLLNMQQFDPATITVLKSSKWETLDDLINDMKARPGEIKLGTVGGANQLLCELLAEGVGVTYKTINFDSGNEMRTALLGGHVDFISGSANGDLGLGDEGRPLGVDGDERVSIWPDTPTFNEALKDYGVTIPDMLGSSRLVAVHADVKKNYPERYEKLLSTYQEAFQNPEYQAALEASGEGAVSALRTPEESNEMNLQVHSIVEQYKDKFGES